MVQGSVAQSELSSKPANDDGDLKRDGFSYNDALNSGSTCAAMALYADDGVFMPPYSQSAVGKERVRKAYDAVFAELKFDVKFTIAELVLTAPDWAYVRTNSAGVTGHASTGKTTAEANQGLFIFKKGEAANGASRATASRRRTRPASEPARWERRRSGG